jgi:hypothetical protein
MPGTPQVSPFIVGPHVKEIRPLDPWQETRSGHDDVYEELGDTSTLKAEPIKVILIDHVPGIGLKGDVVDVDRSQAFNSLVPAQKAVYASEINLRLYRDLIESQSTGGPSSALSALTVTRMQNKVFLVQMSGEGQWELSAWHVRSNLRKQGLIVPLEAIEMPPQTISGPNLNHEAKDFFVTITINRNSFERVPVQCMLHHLGQELDEEWDKPSSQRTCILPDQQALLQKSYQK